MITTRDMDVLIEQWRPLALRLAKSALRRIKGSGVTLDELESAALVGLWRALDSWDEAGGMPLPNWLSRKVYLALLDWLRLAGPLSRGGNRRYPARQLSQLEGQDARHPLDQTGQACRRLLRVDLRDECERALRSLPRKVRDAARLYYLENLSIKDIGVALGLSESRISMILSELPGRVKREQQA